MKTSLYFSWTTDTLTLYCQFTQTLTWSWLSHDKQCLPAARVLQVWQVFVCFSTNVTSVCVFQHKCDKCLCVSAQVWQMFVCFTTSVTSVCVLQHKCDKCLCVSPQVWQVCVCVSAQVWQVFVCFSTSVTSVCVFHHKCDKCLCVSACLFLLKTN